MSKDTVNKVKWGTSLVVQWLRLCASSAEGPGSSPGRGTKNPHAVLLRQKKKKSQTKKYKFGENSFSIYDIFLIFKEHLQIAGKKTNPR